MLTNCRGPYGHTFGTGPTGLPDIACKIKSHSTLVLDERPETSEFARLCLLVVFGGTIISYAHAMSCEIDSANWLTDRLASFVVFDEIRFLYHRDFEGPRWSIEL